MIFLTMLGAAFIGTIAGQYVVTKIKGATK